MPLRTLLLCCLLVSLVPAAEDAAEPEPGGPAEQAAEPEPPPANAHVFTPGELRIYHYETRQVVQQRNLDDELRFESLLRWRFALRCTSVDEQGAELRATVFLVQATHDGPGSHHSVDSSRPADAQPDPLLGHLLRMNGTTLTIRWRDGEVRSVTGSETLIAALAGKGLEHEVARRKREAARAYGPEALRAFWQAVLLEPTGDTEAVELSPPLSGQAERRWQQGAWELSGQGPVGVELATRPAPLRATLTGLQGEGRVRIDASGLLQQADGRLRYGCDWIALGQPASQQHELHWQVVLVDYKPAP